MMIARFAAGRVACMALLTCAGIGLGAGAGAQQVQEQPLPPPQLQPPPQQEQQPQQQQPPVKLAAHFVIAMTHVRVGELTWAVSFADGGYLASADGKASGVFSVLVKGEGSVTTHGTIAVGRLMPITSRSDVSDEDGTYEVRMTFDNGVLAKIVNRGAPPPEDRVRVTPELLHNVADPLSAMLIPYANDAFAPANCDKTLHIFDGRRRYNLALSYKRIDKVKMKRGYAGKALVCGVVLRPIAGYKVGSLLVKYLAGKSDLEMWFAPIAGVAIVAPVRALMPTLIGTMDISADEFETVAPHVAAPAQ